MTKNLGNTELRVLCADMLGSCIKLQALGIDAFFKYSPHVQQVNIDIYEGRWDGDKVGQEPVFNFCFYLDEENATVEAIKASDWLTKAVMNRTFSLQMTEKNTVALKGEVE